MRTHRNRIYKKLGLQSRNDAMRAYRAITGEDEATRLHERLEDETDPVGANC